MTKVKPALSTGPKKCERDLEISSASLTEHEVEGLATRYNFADGHAYHEMPQSLSSVVTDIPNIWTWAASKSIPEVEESYRTTLSRAICSPALALHRHYSIYPTASNAIDVAAAWLNLHSYKVGLVEPTFDNLHLLMKRRGVEVEGLCESDLLNLDRLEWLIDEKGLNSIFVISPNNPTGFTLSESEFGALCELCSRKNVVLISDKTFRFYCHAPFDDYRILLSSGVDFIVIEDTGKTWPTQDLKVSLMSYSDSLAKELRILYEEIFLCSSNFTVALLSRMLSKTTEVGLSKIVWDEVDRRTQLVRSALSSSSLTIIEGSGSTRLPFAWIDCSRTGLTDLELVAALVKRNVALLPGRYFYWNSRNDHTQNVRLSLMRPARMFHDGLVVLQAALKDIVDDEGYGSSNNLSVENSAFA